MMDCTQYRRALLADPHGEDADLRAHAAVCHDCTAYTDRLQRFEDRLDRALRVPVNMSGDARSRAVRPRRLRRRWLAAAASLMLAFLTAGILWLAAPGSSLAADVVNHMAGEPDAWARTDVPVAEPQLDAVMRESHVRLKANAGLVTYASSCSFRGHQVPHLVVQTEAGPVTVMILTHEFAKTRMRFHEKGYEGVIEPVPGHGSLAVLEREPGVDASVIAAVVSTVQNAVDWSY